VRDLEPFGLVVLVAALVGLLAVLSNRISEHLRIPSPAIFLLGAAVAAQLMPALHDLPHRSVTRLVTVALVVILFDGGMQIGWPRFRSSAGPIAVAGVLGTFLTAAAIGLLVHVTLGLSWWVALLLGTAIAPTDPAVVFSVLGNREIAGRSGTILEGESGANDPVGIALMVALLAAGGVSASALGAVAGTFVVEMVVGAAVGLLGARLLLLFMRAVTLPSEALYPLRTLAGAMVIFGAATVLHGSGFLAVFTAGIALGDQRAPYKVEIERFHSALASLGEIVAFMVLGFTVGLGVLARVDVWLPGLLLGAVLAFVVRPLLLGMCLLPFGLPRNERAFVLWAGLKGAVPLLLGSFLLAAEVPDAPRLYGIVVVAVMFSVLVQGTSIPGVARLLRVPMRTVRPEPWAWGVRLRDEPEHVHRFRTVAGSRADGCAVRDLVSRGDDFWVSLVIRDAELVPVHGNTRLRAGDEVLVLASHEVRAELNALFSQPSAGAP
jgi:cell volume regulation protein A